MKSFGNIQRYIKFLDESPYFYFYVMLFCVVVFGFLGIIPLTSSIFKKSSALIEGNKVYQDLVKKEQSLKLASEELRSINPYIFYLEAYMPEDINLDDYLVSLTAVSANDGFDIRRLAPLGDVVNNSLAIQVSFDGYGKITDLVRDVEGLKRVTRITEVEVNRVKGKDRIDLLLQIFSR